MSAQRFLLKTRQRLFLQNIAPLIRRFATKKGVALYSVADRQDLLQQALLDGWIRARSMWRRGIDPLAHCRPLAIHAVSAAFLTIRGTQVIIGPKSWSVAKRWAGHTRDTVRARLSKYALAQLPIHFHPERLSQELLLATGKGNPRAIPERVAIRLDLSAWAAELPEREVVMAHLFASGCTIHEVCQKISVSRWSIAEARKRWKATWERFQSSPQT